MTIRTITLTGARGGQGTSTVAAAIALFAAEQTRTLIVSDDPRAMAALLGVPARAEPADDIEVTPTLRVADAPRPDDEVLIIDGGKEGQAGGDGPGVHYAVLRGPCYLALASLVRNPGPPPDGVILVAEPGRSLTATDVAEVLGVPVVATVEVDRVVARTIDAGLLPARLQRLHQIRPLRHLAQLATTTTTVACTPSSQPTPIPICQSQTPTPTQHTDLPFPPRRKRRGDRAPSRSRCRLRRLTCA